MEIHPDFSELLRLFADFQVEYAIVGGYALAFHGAPRFTGDLDLLVSTRPENAERIMQALHDFGFGDSNLTASDFTVEGRFVRLGHPPVRIDLLTSISGILWEEVRANRVMGRYGAIDVPFISREDFIRNKRASGRTKDLADIEALVGEVGARAAEQSASSDARIGVAGLRPFKCLRRRA
jgi:hypothetical protein